MIFFGTSTSGNNAKNHSPRTADDKNLTQEPRSVLNLVGSPAGVPCPPITLDYQRFIFVLMRINPNGSTQVLR